MPLLHFLLLLFKHLSIILEDVGENRGGYGDIEEKKKLLFSVYVLLA